jgi:hypothetical protein
MDSTTKPPFASIGIDIGKEVFHIVGFSTDGRIAFRRKIKRLALAETFKKLPPCVVGMSYCSRVGSLVLHDFRRTASPICPDLIYDRHSDESAP